MLRVVCPNEVGAARRVPGRYVRVGFLAEPVCAYHRAARLSWARLLKRASAVDLEQCPNCDGELKIIAAIVDAPVIERMQTHLTMRGWVAARVPEGKPS